MPTWEYCELKYVKIRGVIKEIMQWQAHKPTLSGSPLIIFKSEEFARGWSYEKTEEMYEKAYRQLVAQLTIAGWEPVTYRGNGKIESMKRQVDGDTTDSTTNPTDLIKQLANLRDAGILTEQEFQTKKAEILKRM